MSVLECGTLLFIGHKLRESGVLRASDGRTAAQLATYLTLPSVALQSLCNQGPIEYEAWLAAGVAAVCFLTQAASNWIYCMPKPRQERAAVTGSGTGLSLAMIGYPVGEALFGLKGMQPLVLVGALNGVAVAVGSYLLFGSAGPAFPEYFKHEDGGVYRGQWRGMKKEGLGTYTYPSGARYEGEWRDNVKEGRGVYFFPKGGTYEGEWSHGTMEGVGVRTFSSGQVKCGRWKQGQLVSPLELWQCTNAAEGAAEAVMAARRVEVGGGDLKSALQGLVHMPALWAVLAGLAISWLGYGLPRAVDAVTACLAPIHRPLMMLAAGLTLSVELPSANMMGDVVQLVASRFIIPIFVCSTSMAVAGAADPRGACAMATVLFAFLTPIPPQAHTYARKFRLNERLVNGLASTSNVASLLLIAAFSVTAHTSGLFSTPFAPPTSPSLLPQSPPPSVLPLVAFCVAATGALGACVVRAKQVAAQAANSKGGSGPSAIVVPAPGSPSESAPTSQGASTGNPAASWSAEHASAPITPVDRHVRMVYQGKPEDLARAAREGTPGATPSSSITTSSNTGSSSRSTVQSNRRAGDDGAPGVQGHSVHVSSEEGSTRGHTEQAASSKARGGSSSSSDSGSSESHPGVQGAGDGRDPHAREGGASSSASHQPGQQQHSQQNSQQGLASSQGQPSEGSRARGEKETGSGRDTGSDPPGPSSSSSSTSTRAVHHHHHSLPCMPNHTPRSSWFTRSQSTTCWQLPLSAGITVAPLRQHRHSSVARSSSSSSCRLPAVGSCPTRLRAGEGAGSAPARRLARPRVVGDGWRVGSRAALQGGGLQCAAFRL